MITFGQLCAAALRDAKRENPNLPWEQVATIIQTKYELAPKPRAPRIVGKKRERDVLFDALANATGNPAEQLTRPMARAVAVALADIKAVMPDLTVGEINRRAEAYKSKHRDWPLTATSLAKYWGEFGGQRTRTAKSSIYVEPPEWQAVLRRIGAGWDQETVGEACASPWLQVSPTLREEIIRAIQR